MIRHDDSIGAMLHRKCCICADLDPFDEHFHVGDFFHASDNAPRQRGVIEHDAFHVEPFKYGFSLSLVAHAAVAVVFAHEQRLGLGIAPAWQIDC